MAFTYGGLIYADGMFIGNMSAGAFAHMLMAVGPQ